MKKNKQTILFKEFSDAAKYILDIPKPAKNYVPKWYKDDKLFSDGNNDYLKARKNFADATYKLCVPLVDGITSGYTFVTSCEIVITNTKKDNYNPLIEWEVDWQPIDVQKKEVLGGFPIPTGHNPTLFRWGTDWQVITPKGYSLWVTHPVNRYDLPFTTLTAFIDTDMHPSSLVLPFFIKDGFEGSIPAGTPIAQLIPIKRDKWYSKREKFKEGSAFLDRNIMNVNFVRSYKNRFWSKKEYR
jgi:hypothetical protein